MARQWAVEVITNFIFDIVYKPTDTGKFHDFSLKKRRVLGRVELATAFISAGNTCATAFARERITSTCISLIACLTICVSHMHLYSQFLPNMCFFHFLIHFFFFTRTVISVCIQFDYRIHVCASTFMTT